MSWTEQQVQLASKMWAAGMRRDDIGEAICKSGVTVGQYAKGHPRLFPARNIRQRKTNRSREDGSHGISKPSGAVHQDRLPSQIKSGFVRYTCPKAMARKARRHRAMASHYRRRGNEGKALESDRAANLAMQEAAL